MPTWTIDEVEDACNLLYTSRSIDDAKELYELCGGIAHYIFEWKKEEAYQEIDLAIKTCDLGKIIKSVGEVDAPHDTSHVIVHIVVDPQTFQRHKVQFASSIIREKIYQRFLNEQQFSLRNFLKACEDESITGGICGNLLEDFAHKMLKAGGKYEIKLLESEEELREGDTQKKKLKSNNGTSASLINELNLTVKGTFKFSKLEEITAKHQVIKHLNELQNEENETELYFVVPDEIYLTFNKQKFQTKPGKNAERTPPIIHSIKQYSLKIPLDLVWHRKPNSITIYYVRFGLKTFWIYNTKNTTQIQTNPPPPSFSPSTISSYSAISSSTTISSSTISSSTTSFAIPSSHALISPSPLSSPLFYEDANSSSTTSFTVSSSHAPISPSPPLFHEDVDSSSAANIYGIHILYFIDIILFGLDILFGIYFYFNKETKVSEFVFIIFLNVLNIILSTLGMIVGCDKTDNAIIQGLMTIFFWVPAILLCIKLGFWNYRPSARMEIEYEKYIIISTAFISLLNAIRLYNNSKDYNSFNIEIFKIVMILISNYGKFLKPILLIIPLTVQASMPTQVFVMLAEFYFYYFNEDIVLETFLEELMHTREI
ncbi:19597_t:CDS:2 [Entrophospora sp. SA101]|nr:19597_t:CDS:2 [Entrophospora sp. SA101]